MPRSLRIFVCTFVLAHSIYAQDAPTDPGAYTAKPLGNPALPGSVTTVADGFNLIAGGADIGGTNDEGLFVTKELTGNFDQQVRLQALSPSDPLAKAGLMVRETLEANSRSAGILATPALSGVFFQARGTPAIAAVRSGKFPLNYPNTWLRLQRNGNQFTAYGSYDAKTWTQVASTNIAFPEKVFFGMVAASRSTNSQTLAEFRDLGPTASTLTSPASLPPREPPGPSTRKTGLVISEIMYKPAQRTDGRNIEFVEVFNSTPFNEDLSGFELAGDIDFTFAAGTIIKGGALFVVAKVPADVRSVYGITNILGPYTGSLKTSGTVRLRSELGAVYQEILYSDQPPWPVAANGTGHSLILARPSYGEGFPAAWDISDIIGGSPGMLEAFRPSPLRNIVLNELLANTDGDLIDFIELYNHSNDAVDVSGCILTDRAETNKFVVPAGTTIPARGFVSFDQSQLGFSLDSGGETVFFLNPERTRVLDTVAYEAQESGVSLGRYPDGAKDFYRLQARTPAAPNTAIRNSDVVINELMYAPISRDDADQYLELYNQSARSIDLAGWEIKGGIDFTFPKGASIPANGYVVVAKDAARLLTNYANLTTGNTFGNFSGRMNRTGERIVLTQPQTPVTQGVADTNVTNVGIDEVTYCAGGRWGDWSRNGGSSLELLDARANRRLAANWADSDETKKAPWTTVQATGVLDNGDGYAGTGARNIEIVMMNEGECLVDNLEVFRPPTTSNLVTNADFEAGTNSWVWLGDHIRTTIETNEGFQSAKSLHIRASARGDTSVNKVRSALTTRPTASQTVTIRAKVRWLKGWPEVLFRLHGNYFEAFGRMDLPKNLGTPGAQNSRAVTNAPPAIYEVTHNPPVPVLNQPVVVTARLHDPDGIAFPSVQYRIDPSTNYTNSVIMVDNGTNGDAIAGDGLYSATIPAPAVASIVAFYVGASDSQGATATFPSLAPAHECLVRFGDPSPITLFGIYRQWFPARTVTTWNSRPALSNERVEGTFVYGDFRVIYNFYSRWAGSPYHQGFGSPASDGHYSIEFPLDDLLLGTENFNKVHAPGNSPFDDATIQREQTGFWIARQLGLPWLYRRYVAMYFNGARRSTLMEDTQVPGSDFIEEYFSDDPDGHLYKIQPWFEFENSAAKSIGFENKAWAVLTRISTTGGALKTARYRWNYLARGYGTTANDYTSVFDLITAANSPGNAGQQINIEKFVEMEQWMRIFATHHSVGDWDHYGSQNAQNMYGYKPENGKWNLMIWDFNILLGNSGSWASGQNLFTVNSADAVMTRVFNNPPFRRAYWRALQEICNGPFDTNKLTWLDERYSVIRADGINISSPSPIRTFIVAAKSSILTQLRGVDAPAFIVNESDVITDTNVVTLTGSAPVMVKDIVVNGEIYPVSWTTLKTWSIKVPLSESTNQLAIGGLSVSGDLVPGARTNITVVTTAVLVPEEHLLINEIMASNSSSVADPADGKFQDWFELYNPTETKISLDGLYLTDNLANPDKYKIPAGYSVPARAFLVVWADDETSQNSSNRTELHSNFKLAKNGGSLALIGPNGKVIDTITYTPQAANVSTGRFPDGESNFIALTTPTAGAPNVAASAEPRFTLVTASSDGLSLTWTTVAGQSYRIEARNGMTQSTWTPVRTNLMATGGTLSSTVSYSDSSVRFYRVVKE